MFGTFIVDAYKKEDAREIANSLEEICSPKDTFGWSSSGIYCFWNYYSKEILYIGLAVDLGERFKQHNSISYKGSVGCKSSEITNYFGENEKLGYSIFVQSPLGQPQTYRNKSTIGFDDDTICISEESIENLRVIEGSFIEAVRQQNGVFPNWNQISGSTVGKNRAINQKYVQLEKYFTGDQSNFLVAKSSIREIANNSTFERYETSLHGARMSMLSRPISSDLAISELLSNDKFFNQTWVEIIKDNYLEKLVQI